MASVNKAILIGNLGQDPDMKYMPNGDAVCNISIATTASWKNKAGEKQEKTEWHRVVLYRKLGEIAGEYLRKGSSVYIEGAIETNKWQDKNGIEKQTTQIVASEMRMLSSQRSEGASESQRQPRAGAMGEGNQDFDDFVDDIPFN